MHLHQISWSLSSNCPFRFFLAPSSLMWFSQFSQDSLAPSRHKSLLSVQLPAFGSGNLGKRLSRDIRVVPKNLCLHSLMACLCTFHLKTNQCSSLANCLAIALFISVRCPEICKLRQCSCTILGTSCRNTICQDRHDLSGPCGSHRCRSSSPFSTATNRRNANPKATKSYPKTLLTIRFLKFLES